MQTLKVLSAAAVSVALVSCSVEKSSTPLAPTVAGPIAGVTISAPKTLTPAAGAQIPGDQQPLTLLLENASSTGQRPLTYLFEVATDSGFSNRVFSQDSVPSGDTGRTSLKLTSSLPMGKVYYWRAKAADGANQSPYSSSADFNVFTPVSFDKPTLLAPINNAKVSNTRPSFSLADAPHQGSPLTVSYVIEISTDSALSAKVAVWQFDETPNQTNFPSPSDLPVGVQLFWHARAFASPVIGPWSDTQTFSTPAPPPPPPPPGNGGGGSSGTGWQNCGSTPGLALVACVHDVIHPTDSASDMEVVKRVAWLLRAQGGGLLIKNGGDNVVSWQGYNFSASRVCLPSTGPNAYLWKAISDAGPGGANGASWQDNGPVSASGSSCVPAIDPSLP